MVSGSIPPVNDGFSALGFTLPYFHSRWHFGSDEWNFDSVSVLTGQGTKTHTKTDIAKGTTFKVLKNVIRDALRLNDVRKTINCNSIHENCDDNFSYDEPNWFFSCLNITKWARPPKERFNYTREYSHINRKFMRTTNAKYLTENVVNSFTCFLLLCYSSVLYQTHNRTIICLFNIKKAQNKKPNHKPSFQILQNQLYIRKLYNHASGSVKKTLITSLLL